MKKNVVKNTTMLYLMSAAKLVLPLISVPYLSNVLSTEAYGSVVYVKSIMTFMQIIIDFAFGLSGTKDIVRARDSKEKTEKEASSIFTAQFFLACGCFIVLLGMVFIMPVFDGVELYTLLTFGPCFLSIFIMNYLFRGLEKMEVVTLRFVIMKSISTALTFVFIHGDPDLLWIPVLDIFSSMIAILLVRLEIKKYGYQIRLSGFKTAWKKLTEAAVYFISNMASTAFGALNTFLIGVFMTKTDTAYWGNAMILISAILALYDPIIDGLYPEMMRSKDLNYIKKVLAIFMPVIAAGCVFSFYAAPFVLGIFGKEKYISAIPVFRRLIPVLFFSFPAQMLGWPTLGAINRSKETTASTIIAAIFQCTGLLVLGITQHFNLITIATLRCVTEFFMMCVRLTFVLRFRDEFNRGEKKAAI
ncbi:MAG: oligosaccharide flippase family protein [Erysipelotrichales bacterium]|nr:oligosaccharide flippase family protein [Erysipelotrichales bacterium]